MSSTAAAMPDVFDVFTTAEIAHAAGATTAEVRLLVQQANLSSIDGRFFTLDQAVHAITLLRARAAGRPQERRLFAPIAGTERRGAMPALASGAFHAGLLAVMVLVGTLAVRSEPAEQKPIEPARLVFLATPGPGGGGGGGGLRQPKPPAKAELKGKSKLASPVVVTKVAKSEPVERKVTPPPPPPDPRPEPKPEPKPVPPPPPAPPAPAPPAA
jgi:hypothetical protein